MSEGTTPLHAVVLEEFEKAQEQYKKAKQLYNSLNEQTESARLMAHISSEHLEYWRQALYHAQHGPSYPGGVHDGE